MKENKMKKWLTAFLKDEEGASGIEYALVAAMVAIALVAFVTPVKEAITGIFTSIQGALNGAGGAGG
ncbi:Flp family type IVb pilin [Methylobacter sp. YRD-M1]|uniref:Flp family type IVb pilin n=1 Tax=Methylobacter sp. YRD-M1 TaxID=2911520 RepID=UPI00227D12AF|nr:Flp family type IVb pilin [Methylobacter sp. YRD-M1]WAK03625.1 Flp family type IVb pilin [Methylobacter sp. YRD-M1]